MDYSEHFAKSAAAPRIYSTARAKTVASHDEFLGTLRGANPAGTYTLLTADASLVSDINGAVDAVLRKETKVDLLFMSPGFFTFEGHVDTKEGLDPSMSTRYYSRLRAVQRLLPLLNAAPGPRVVSVLAAGEESPLNEAGTCATRRTGQCGTRRGTPAPWARWRSSASRATTRA